MKIGDRAKTPKGEGVVENRDDWLDKGGVHAEIVKVNGIWWDSRVLTPIEPGDYAKRLRLVMGLFDLWGGKPLEKPQLMICPHSEQCDHIAIKDVVCGHWVKHAHKRGCDDICAHAGNSAKCIPYVEPKPEEKDWFSKE